MHISKVGVYNKCRNCFFCGECGIMKKIFCGVKKYIPTFAIVSLIFAIVAGIVYIISILNPAFAEFITSTVGFAFRRVLAAITDIIPFSLAELLIVLSPIGLAAIIFGAVRKGSGVAGIRYLAGLVAVILMFFSCYTFTLGIGYRRTALASRLEIDEVEIDSESLISTISVLKSECEALSDELGLSDSGSSKLPISFDDVSEKITDAYKVLDSDFPSLDIKTFDSKAKEVVLSKPMSSLEILGIYTFFTGESNVNVYYPDYTIPFTVAHELAHQRGIARENEANFIAFLVCIRADDPYIKYSGYMNMFEYVASALAKTDPDALSKIYADLHPGMLAEIRAYRDFYYENKNEFWSALSDFANDTYLKSQGTEGIVSYGLVVRLCVSYYSAK